MAMRWLAGRAIIRIAADDAATDENPAVEFLQRLVTQDVSGPLPVYAGLLTPQGKTQFDFIIWGEIMRPESQAQADNTPPALLIDCEESMAEALTARLRLYRLRAPINITVEERLAVCWAPPTTPQDALPPEATPDPRLAALGYRWLSPQSAAHGLAQGDEAWLQHRLSHSVAEGRDELEGILWLETNADLLNGVSFTKGCYIGQENTARMNWRAKINRRLVVVAAAESDPKRQKCAWPELGLALDHLRIAEITAPPNWMKPALSEA